jgi:hypothetical protein
MSLLLDIVDITIGCVVGVPMFFIGTACVGMTYWPKEMWYQPFLGYGLVLGASVVSCYALSGIIRCIIRS